MRSSSSTAANYRATGLAQSKAAFTAKLSIVLEEADESQFWLEFIRDEEMLKDSQLQTLIHEAEELAKIFTTSRKTAQSRK